MKNLFHQTKQAFYFSLAFYILSTGLYLLSVPFAPIFVSISLLISLIWVFLVLREIMSSTKVDPVERILLVLFIIFFNIFAGLVYFFMLRERITGKQNIQKCKNILY
jgi:hypothetical protein